jgi:hypothetical protein
VQNMLLAARALGLGATLTTLYLQFEKEAQVALRLPPGVQSYALPPSATRLGQSAMSREPMWFTNTEGPVLRGSLETQTSIAGSCLIGALFVAHKQRRAAEPSASRCLQTVGRIFALSRNRFVGSYRFFNRVKRSKFEP